MIKGFERPESLLLSRGQHGWWKSNDNLAFSVGNSRVTRASCSSQDGAAYVFRSRAWVWVGWVAAVLAPQRTCADPTLPLTQHVLDKITNPRPGFPCRDHVHLHVFATSLVLVTAQDVFLLLSIPFIKRLLSPADVLTSGPSGAPRVFLFSGLSFCLFAAPTSLSTSFILTFKISKLVLKCHKHCLCYALASECQASQDAWRGGPPATVRQDARALPLQGDENVGRRGLAAPPLPLQGHMPAPLTFWPSFPLTLPGPNLAHPECHRITPNIPFIQESHSCLPHCMISSPSAWFLVITGPPIFRKGRQRKQTWTCLGLQP